jgi:hypothetical protein
MLAGQISNAPGVFRAGALRAFAGTRFATRAPMRKPRRLLLSAVSVSLAAWLLGAGCAPQVLSMDVGNPARGGDAAGAMQAYEIPPFREEHRYEATLGKWTPSSLGVRIRLVNADRCGEPSSYAFALMDDRGNRYPFQPSGGVQEKTIHGHLGATIHDASVDGAFPVPLGARTQYLVLQIRPVADRGCTAVDFRWNFKA